MKFSYSVDINAPREKVVKLFNNTGHYPQWFASFVSYEQLSGNYAEVGAKARVMFKNNMEITETILVNNLPQEKTMLSEHKHMTNTMKNTFDVIDENITRYTVEIEYTKFVGFMPKLMSKLFPSIFKNGTKKMADDFKKFVEKTA